MAMPLHNIMYIVYSYRLNLYTLVYETNISMQNVLWNKYFEVIADFYFPSHEKVTFIWGIVLWMHYGLWSSRCIRANSSISCTRNFDIYFNPNRTTNSHISCTLYRNARCQIKSESDLRTSCCFYSRICDICIGWIPQCD